MGRRVNVFTPIIVCIVLALMPNVVKKKNNTPRSPLHRLNRKTMTTIWKHSFVTPLRLLMQLMNLMSTPATSAAIMNASTGKKIS